MKTIVMTGDSVPAIEKLRKDISRRTLKGAPVGSNWTVRELRLESVIFDGGGPALLLPLPYKVGDLLRVKESWRPLETAEGPLIEFRDGKVLKPNIADFEKWLRRHELLGRAPLGRWQNPRFCPVWVSRLILTVVDVRVERLRDIGWPDVIREGIKDPYNANKRVDPETGLVAQFSELWDRLNKKSAPWSSNPWVEVLTFKVIKP